MISKIEFKNMLSFGGNVVNEIDLADVGISEIAGENGLGKSNITLLLKIAAYFDYPTKITNVVNNNHNEGYLRVYYSNGKIAHHEYTAKHGLNSLKLYASLSDLEQNRPIDTGGIQSTKEHIVSNEFGIPKKMFYNVFIPNIERFKSFIGMSPQDSRDIRDELFSLGGINEKLSKVKSKINKTNSENSIIMSRLEESNKLKLELDEKIKHVLTEATQNNEKKIADEMARMADISGRLNGLRLRKANLEKEFSELQEDKKAWDRYKLQLERDETKKELEAIAREYKELETKLKTAEDNLDGAKKHSDNIAYEELKELKAKLELEDNAVKESLSDKKKKLEAMACASLLKKFQDAELSLKLKESEYASLGYDQKILELKGSISVLSDRYNDLMQLKKTDERVIEVINLGENCPTCDQCIPIELIQQKPILEKQVLEKKATLVEMFEEHKKLTSQLKETEESKKNLEITIEKLKHSSNSLKEALEKYDEAVSSQAKLVENPSDEEIEKAEKELVLATQASVEVSNSLASVIFKMDAATTHVGDYNAWKGVNIDDTKKEIAELASRMSTLKSSEDVKSGVLMKVEDGLKGGIDILKPDSNLEELDNKMKSLDEHIQEVTKQVSTEETNLGVSEKILEEARRFDPETEAKPLRDLMSTTEKKIEEDEAVFNLAKLELEKLAVLEHVFSDDGMKKYILAKIRKGFTAQVNADLNEFGMTAQFDDNFSVKLFKRGKEMDIISTGQKKVFDTIVCANFILLYSKKDGIKAPVILDECMSNLRAKWSEKLLRILDSKLASNGFSVKFVNHEKLNVNLSRKKINLHDRGLYTGITIES